MWQERLDREAVRALFTTLGTMEAPERPEFVLFTGNWGIDTTTTPSALKAATARSQAEEGARGQPEAAGDTTPTTVGATPQTGAASPQQQRQAPAAAPTADRWVEQADTVAALLSLSPVKQIYWVPGNNDIARERADPADLAKADEFTGLVSQRLRNGVTLQNLTACYAGQPGTCTVDVPNTRYTIVGFPSVSFKNRGVPPADTARFRQIQEQLLVRASDLVAGVQSRGRRVLLATHIPELDDPFERGQQLYAGKERTRAQLGASAWNVSDTVFARWKRLVESPAVATVLAGHFHDSHREIYEPPYTWAETSSLRADVGKLLITPPLSVKNQDASPVQARGFTIIRLLSDSIGRRQYWLNPATRQFVAEEQRGDDGGPERGGRGFWGRYFGWILGTFGWLWNLAPDADILARAAVVFLALIFAFLTVAKLWKVPAPSSTASTTSTTTTSATTSVTTTTATANEAGGPPAVPSTPLFEGNLSRLVWSGLTGIAVVSILTNSFWESSKLASIPYYVVWFVFLFLVSLVLSAIFRAGIEGARSRVLAARFVPAWQPPPKLAGEDDGKHRGRVSRERRVYWRRRIWTWILSLRELLLVMTETFTNVLFGRSYETNVVWEQRIITYQRSLLRTADRIREEINTAVQQAIVLRAHEQSSRRPVESGTEVRSDQTMPTGEQVVGRKPPAASTPPLILEQGVRVAISVLSDDGSFVFYISAASGSLSKVFNKRSVAWVAVRSGQARWWRLNYDEERIVLYDNDKEPIVEAAGTLLLSDYFEVRENPDYRAFIVLPVPWRRRDLPASTRRGAIHISFSQPEWLDLLWPGIHTAAPLKSATPAARKEGTPQGEPSQTSTTTTLVDPYEGWRSLLDDDKLPDPALRAVLNESLNVLAELISQFDQTIYESRIRPRDGI
ncbi:MAG TPA: hypothetical protein VHG28_22635 [Longimicrobiaceae bacterium]|nr:hypothetical protein [Longimicrobiaceae bacterium]